MQVQVRKGKRLLGKRKGKKKKRKIIFDVWVMDLVQQVEDVFSMQEVVYSGIYGKF